MGHQVPGMVGADGHSGIARPQLALLTEGIWRENDRGDFEVYRGSWQTISAGNQPLQMSSIESWLLSTIQLGGLSYFHCQHDRDTAGSFVSNLHQVVDEQDLYEDHRSHEVIYRPPPDRAQFSTPSDFVVMVSAIAKVGWTRARAIEAAVNGDFEYLMRLSPKQMTDIEGVGMVIAGNILEGTSWRENVWHLTRTRSAGRYRTRSLAIRADWDRRATLRRHFRPSALIARKSRPSSGPVRSASRHAPPELLTKDEAETLQKVLDHVMNDGIRKDVVGHIRSIQRAMNACGVQRAKFRVINYHPSILLSNLFSEREGRTDSCSSDRTTHGRSLGIAAPLVVADVPGVHVRSPRAAGSPRTLLEQRVVRGALELLHRDAERPEGHQRRVLRLTGVEREGSLRAGRGRGHDGVSRAPGGEARREAAQTQEDVRRALMGVGRRLSGEGPITADLMVIGEWPGKEEGLTWPGVRPAAPEGQ